MFDLIEFLAGIFKKESQNNSRNRARERLKLVLVSDRASLTPRMMDSLRGELIEVVSRYMTIDSTGIEMGVERKNGSMALAANIPIINVKREKSVKPKIKTPSREKPSEKKAGEDQGSGLSGLESLSSYKTKRKDDDLVGKKKSIQLELPGGKNLKDTKETSGRKKTAVPKQVSRRREDLSSRRRKSMRTGRRYRAKARGRNIRKRAHV